MEPKIREYIENLFSSAPRTKQSYELKEEIICNTIERYHDFLREGNTDGNAYNLAISGIGDINELLEALGAEPQQNEQFTDAQLAAVKDRLTIFKTVAIVLYMLCIIPVIFWDEFFNISEIGVCLMFLMISTATGLLVYSNKTKYIVLDTESEKIKRQKIKALLRAFAIGGYISCCVPIIFLDIFGLDILGVIAMFIIIAASTALIIISKNRDDYKKADDSLVENFKEFNGRKKRTSTLYKVLVAILWCTVSVIYIFITVFGTLFFSGSTGMVSWIIFLVAVALQQLMRAIFDYVEASK